MATQPDGQSCETCAYFIKGTCRRSLPQREGGRWAVCDPSDWCFQWKSDEAVKPLP